MGSALAAVIEACRLPSGQIARDSESSTSVYQDGIPIELRISVTHTVLFNADALPAGTGGRLTRDASKLNFSH